MLISVKLFTKCIIIIYALGSVHEKFSIWIKVIPKSIEILGPGLAGRMAEPFQIETGIPNWFTCKPFHVLNSMYYIRFGSWKVWHLNWAFHYSDWPFNNLVLTTCALTLKMTNAQVAETSINSTTVLFRTTLEPGWSYSTYLHVWNDCRVQTIHFKRTLLILIFFGCFNHHKGVFKFSSHGNYP